MSAKRMPVDALSRALCPSIDTALLSRPISWPRRARVTTQQQNPGPPRSCCAGQVRAAHTDNSAKRQFAGRVRYSQWATPLGSEQGPAVGEEVQAKRLGPGQGSHQGVLATNPSFEQLKSRHQRAPTPKGKPLKPFPFGPPKLELPGSRPPPQEDEQLPRWVVGATTPAIYEGLRHLREKTGKGNEIRRVVKYLVEERKERPNVFLYEALVTANWDTTTGNAAALSEIMKEMRTGGMGFSSGFYHSALRLLAIHPDYLARTTILQKMKDALIDLTDEGRFSVVLGLLRDGQEEMALNYRDQMRREGVDIPGWVSEIFIYVLVMRGHVDEALGVFHEVLDEARNKSMSLPPVLWYYLLDECSRSMHYDGTRFIWEEMVEQQQINPSDGMVLNVLNTAARHGDSALATAAIELLSGRQVKLGLHHYEPLLESYVQVRDVENAFRVLCIMADVGFQLGPPSTRSVFQMLKRTPELADEAVRVLGDLSKDHDVPVAAVNVLLEALIQTPQPMSRTLEVYHSVRDICKSGPSPATFEVLLDGCTTSEHAVALVSQMDLFSIRPTPAILDGLTRCFVHDGSLDVAMMYLDEMSRFPPSSPWATEGTLSMLLHRCYRDGDARAFKVLGEAKRRGVDLGESVLSKLREMRAAQAPKPEPTEI